MWSFTPTILVDTVTYEAKNRCHHKQLISLLCQIKLNLYNLICNSGCKTAQSFLLNIRAAVRDKLLHECPEKTLCVMLIYPHVRHCCLYPVQEPFPGCGLKHLQGCRERNWVSASPGCSGHWERPSWTGDRQSITLVQRWIRLQNLLIKAVVKSFWHLGFFLTPSKVSWSSAADSNEERIRH